MRATRRDILQGMGCFAAMSAASSAIPAFAQVRPPARATAPAATAAAATEESVKTVCVHCVNFCALDVRKVGGVIRSIRPDPARRDVYNHGICPKGVASAFDTYNPYRIKRPLKRTNPAKGLDQDPRWVEITWDEAFDTIATRLARIKADNPAKLIWQHGHGKYLIGDQFPKAFARAFGTPNLIHRTTTCEAARHVGDDLTWGNHGFMPDIDNCNLFIAFGSNYFEAEQNARWMDHAITHAKERGMKVVVVEPRLSHAAAKADQWIPIRPGKDVVFVMALTKLLIDAGQIDEEFLRTYTNAPELVGPNGRILRDGEGKPLVWDPATSSAKPLADGVTPALRGTFAVDGVAYRPGLEVYYADHLAELTPDAAAEIAGVPAETIRELATTIARAARLGTTTRVDGYNHRYRPVCIHTWRGMTAKEYGVQNWRAGLILQMVLGTPDAVGGQRLSGVYGYPAYFNAARCEYPPRRVDLATSVYFPHGHHDVCQQVALTVLDPQAYGLPYVPEMQIFYATNRPASTSDTGPQYESLKKTFNVTIELNMSETAWMSDIVLPDLSFLESWHFPPTRSTPWARHVGMRRPVTNAYGLQHDAYSILWELAKRLNIRDAYIDGINSYWNLRDAKLDQGRDYSAREAVEVIWRNATRGRPFEVAETVGFVTSRLTPAEFYGAGVENRFKGPGKPKMQFYGDGMVGTAEVIRQTVERHGIRNLDVAKYRLAYAPLPRKEHAFPTPHREAANLPFYLISFKRMYRNQSASSATNPILNLAIGRDTSENFVMINPRSARELRIADGDVVAVETRIGRLTGKCKFTEGIRPDTVGISYHYGHNIPTWPDFARKGMDVNRIIELHPDVVCGMNSTNDTKCRVSKA